jgi:hypothetical protein
MPKITVGIPAYKAKFLVQAISSVLAQTLGDFQLLVSDDSPEGAAGEIVRRFRDPRIRLIEGPRKGLVPNSVNIWNHAESDLLKFLYDDDYLFPTALEELSVLLDRNPNFTFAAARRVIVDQYGRELARPITYETDDWMWFEPDQLARYVARNVANPIGEPSNILIRRTAFPDSSCLSRFADVPITHLIDVAFMLNAAQRGPCAATGKYLSALRQHPEQVSARSTAPGFSLGVIEWEVCLRGAVQLGLAPPHAALDGVSKLEQLYKKYGAPFPEIQYFFQQLPALREMLGGGTPDVLTSQFRTDVERLHKAISLRGDTLPQAAAAREEDRPALRVHASVDRATRRGLSGWAWIPDQPDEIVEVEALVGGRVVGHARADEARADLVARNIGTGAYGFDLKFYQPVVGDEPPRLRFFSHPEWHPGEISLPPVRSSVSTRTEGADAVLAEHARYTAQGPGFEEFAGLSKPRASRGGARDPLLIAFYLPQFHAIPENDRNWGPGFTEWRQLAKGIPRFPGHYQPRTPRDLGFYNLLREDVLAAQCALAQAAGVGAFGFYYYWFDGKRVLERPTELFLGSDIQMPFMIIWANENWTRGWDGSEDEILLKQSYHGEDEGALLADLARHMLDPRYVRLEGRPLFVIYNPSPIPDTPNTLARWRRIWAESHGLNPLIFMAQTFHREDPRPFGLDGALEFPPHKLAARTPGREVMEAFSPDFASQVIPYEAFMRASLAEPPPPFPLIKTIVPSWDNEPRKPNRGLLLEGSTPQKYQGWLQVLIQRAMDRPIGGVPIVGINAWNEWAEGAYLEPDVHFGSAYLNATARALEAALRNRAPPDAATPEQAAES